MKIITKYKIEKGDKFICLNDYVMYDDTLAYTKGKEYISEHDGCITDNENCKTHGMNDESDFFDFFKLINQ